MLFQENEVIDLFHNKLKSDENLDLTQLDNPLDQSEKAFEEAENIQALAG